jgi:large subunit ribosomal protein L25
MVSVPARDFIIEYQKGGIKTRMVELDINGKKHSVITKSVQKHPVTDMPIHLDFLRVDKDTSIVVSVAIHVKGEDKCVGVKKGGVANLVSRTIELVCHPADIPAFIDIDISTLDIGQNIHISDVNLPKGVEPKDSSNFTVVSIIGRSSEDSSDAEGAASAE